jgi:hypothetical protein
VLIVIYIMMETTLRDGSRASAKPAKAVVSKKTSSSKRSDSLNGEQSGQ